MSSRWNGGVIGVANAPTTGKASGVWSMAEAERYILSQQWPGPASFTTGTVQTVSQSGSTAIQIADGNIVTGALINTSASSISMRYRSLTVNGGTAVYGTQQSVSFSNCGGSSYNTLNPASPNICSGMQITQDGTYTGFGAGYYKNLSVTGKTLTFSSESLSTAVSQSNWTDAPGTDVTNATSVNIVTGYRYYVAGGGCGRLTNADIALQVYYKTVTIS